MIKKISFYIFISLIICSCSFEMNKSQTEILFDAIAYNLEEPNDSAKKSIKEIISNYDLNDLDSTHQKAFWFNAYNVFLEDLSHHPTGYMDFDRFLRQEFTIAQQEMTTKELIQKIEAFKDPRVLICLDFYTTTSSPTYHNALNENTEIKLDSICSLLINDPSFVRVKKDAEKVFYPEHFDWHLSKIHSEISSKEIIMSYIHDKSISNYEFTPYPFSYKLRK